jgi:hypothetical protein
MLVSDLLYAAFRIAGILLAPMRGASNPEITDALLVLASMLDTWLAERLTVYAENRSLFPLTANQQYYSIGAVAANWTLAQRPERIERAGYIFTNVTPPVEEPFKILSDQEWAAVSPKELQSTIPTTMHYQALTPNGVVALWPIPTDVSQVGQVAIYTWAQIPVWTASTTTVTLPPAAQEAIEYCLAVRLAARYPRRANISQWAINNSYVAKQKYKTMNAQVLLMQCERANQGGNGPGGRYNPISNSYNN